MSHYSVIAIDGPAASGKSTVARTLARKLAFLYVNSGAFYRSTTWFVLQQNVDSEDEPAVEACLHQASVETRIEDDQGILLLNGQDLAGEIHRPEVNQNVSQISKIGGVREILTTQLRSFADQQNLVMEGRDIGSSVFPKTPYKFYIDASPEVRAQRRAAQGQTDDLAERDRIDSQRVRAPLTIAEDAQVIDSSRLTVDGVVGEIIGRLKQTTLHLPSHL